jgi:hypothetical protein
VCPFSLVVLFSRSFLTHVCRRFVVVRLGGGVAGRLFVTCRQYVAPCFHLSASSRVGWEDGSRPPLDASGCRNLKLALLLRYPPFVVFECCWMRRSWGVGKRVSSFPLLAVVVALGRLSCRSFSSSPPRVACFLSIDRLLLGFGGRLREVGFGGLRKLGSVSSDRQQVHFSERTSPCWRGCFDVVVTFPVVLACIVTP